MKNPLYIILMILLPMAVSSQLHINVGVVDIQKRMDGNTLAWEAGYTQFLDRIGFSANARYTGVVGDNYYSLESYLKIRVADRGYRLDVGGGAGWNLDEHDFYPMAHIRNSFRIDEGTWINIDFDNAFRKSQDWNGGGLRSETYLMLGIGLDVTRLGQRNLKKHKRFF